VSSGIRYSLRMWRWVAVGLLLAGAPGPARADEPARFASPLPQGVGDVSSWAIESGEFQNESARGAYRLYVNPQRSGLYQLMRYRVELLVPTGAVEQRRGGAERVVFIRRPGVREPMDCWIRLPGDATEWRTVAAGTDEYLVEMSVVIRVLAAQRAAQAPPTSP
jgi:hypothetical protein